MSDAASDAPKFHNGMTYVRDPSINGWEIRPGGRGPSFFVQDQHLATMKKSVVQYIDWLCATHPTLVRPGGAH